MFLHIKTVSAEYLKIYIYMEIYSMFSPLCWVIFELLFFLQEAKNVNVGNQGPVLSSSVIELD